MNGFGLEHAAERAGRHRWAEMRLFEVMGGWVQTVPEPDVKIRLHTDSYRHAWHAELWRRRLPGGPGAADEGLTVPGDEGMGRVMDALGGPGGAAGTLEKLVGLYRVVLPRRVATCRQHRETASEVRDGSAIRVLDLVLDDEEEDWRRGELLLQSLLRTEEDVHRAAAHQARLEALLASPGPGPTLTPPVR